MALYPGAVHRLITPDANDPKQPMRAVVLHVDAGNASTLYDLFLANQKPGGSKVEAHFFVKKNGVVEQYRDTDYQADAAFASNGFAIQVETQGYGTGEWTHEQVVAIKTLLLWCHHKHNIPLAKITSDHGEGVGYHSQFAAWNNSNHSCPGPDRIKQFNSLLVPWMHAVSTVKQHTLPPVLGPTNVSTGRQKIQDGLADLDQAVKNGRKIGLLVKAIRTLTNKLPGR